MRLLRCVDGTKWGDIDARFGSPSYVLEPGDPAYCIPPDDSRYLQFSFNIPANPSLPEGVTSLTAAAAGA